MVEDNNIDKNSFWENIFSVKKPFPFLKVITIFGFKFKYNITRPKLIMTLLVKDEEDIIETNIKFHKTMGVDGFIVTTNNSTDNTNTILEKLKKEGLILEIIYEKDTTYHQDIWVDRMIKLATKKYHADWIINADADEFFYSKQLNLKLDIKEAIKTKLNVIYVDSETMFPDDREDYLTCPYFITKPLQEYELANLGLDKDEYFKYYLWQVFSNIYVRKVIHNTKNYKKIEMGNHDVQMRRKRAYKTHNIILYHFPVRNYIGYEKKILRYIDSIINLPHPYGTHIKPIIQLYKDNKLKDDYNKKYGKEIRELLMNEGVVCIDKTFINFLNHKGLH